MKKVILFSFAVIAISFTVTAQNMQQSLDAKFREEAEKSPTYIAWIKDTQIQALKETIKEQADLLKKKLDPVSCIATQQIFKDFHGITYRIVINEYNNTVKNELLVFKMQNDSSYTVQRFQLAPKVQNVEILETNDNKRLLFTYTYLADKKRIEFN